MIQKCINYGEINGSGMYRGGIVGYLRGTVDSCVNRANFSGTMNTNRVGGICGHCRINSVITNCYNTGNGTSNGAMISGIVGDCENQIRIENCYSVVRFFGSSSSLGYPIYRTAIVNVNNCYYDGDVSQKTDSNGENWHTSDMKTEQFVNALGDAYKMDTEHINGRYPILKWETAVTNPFDEKEGKEGDKEIGDENMGELVEKMP